MKAVIQRVSQASVVVDGEQVGAIEQGLLVFLGVGRSDTSKDVEYLANKIVGLRIFEDENGKLNLSVQDIGGRALIVSQFTLWGDCRKGRRPSFVEAAPPDIAEKLYLEFVEKVAAHNVPTATGRFRAMMDVHLVNDGPVTLILDTEHVK